MIFHKLSTLNSIFWKKKGLMNIIRMLIKYLDILDRNWLKMKLLINQSVNQ